jgi:hypothetical protein
MMNVIFGKAYGPWWSRLILLGIFMFSILGHSLRADDWTASTSEEQGEASPAICGSELVSGLRCSGRYCDNVALKCSRQEVLGERSWSPYISDEGNGQFICPDGRFVDGVRCSGRYCDNLSVRCAEAPQLEAKRCYWAPAISEENSGTIDFGSGTYLKGVRCSGRYCDNVEPFICQTEKPTCTDEACRAEQARRFAPVLRFDQVQGAPNKCLPSDAGDYYELRKSGSKARVCNTDISSIENGLVPIYYAYQDCSLDTTVIMYWFFYGYQDTCTGSLGSHDADWERVAVKIRNNQVERVQFYQHGGHYTRTPNVLEFVDGTHPVAYVGKNSHGSYHDAGGSGSCLYFEDYRNPGSRDLRMQTWKNLVELKETPDAPEWMRTKSDLYFDGIPGPLARGINLCALPGCDGKDFQIGSALCFGQCGCSKSSIGDAPF